MHAMLRDATPPLTRSVEDYLKVIYHLSSQGGFASTRDIAGVLRVAPPSVSGMVKRLSETGLIEHVPYRGVQLTAQGRRAALKMIRRHRDRKSTRLNSSHVSISYAVFCLKKKKHNIYSSTRRRLRRFAASWLLTALLRLFAMTRSDERFRWTAATSPVCSLLTYRSTCTNH